MINHLHSNKKTSIFSLLSQTENESKKRNQLFKKCFNRICKATGIMLRQKKKKKEQEKKPIKKGSSLLCKKERENMKRRCKTLR